MDMEVVKEQEGRSENNGLEENKGKIITKNEEDKPKKRQKKNEENTGIEEGESRKSKRMMQEKDTVTAYEREENNKKEEWNVNKLEEKILDKITNQTSVYATSKEEPSMMYYVKGNNLMAANYIDAEQMTKYREQLKEKTSRYKITEIGEAAVNFRMNENLITGSIMKNKTKVIYIMHNAKLPAISVDMINKGTAKIIYKSKAAANECVEFFASKNKIGTAYIDRRETMYKGVITDWPYGIPELYEAMDNKEEVISYERIKKRIKDAETNKYSRVATGNIAITWVGKIAKKEISIYNKTGHLRVRPFIETVKICYNCFKYGHFKDKCRVEAKCLVCGKGVHGACSATPACVNCGEQHVATFKGCATYQRNKEIQLCMAHNNCSFRDAENIMKGNVITQTFNRFTAPGGWPALPSSYASKIKQVENKTKNENKIEIDKTRIGKESEKVKERDTRKKENTAEYYKQFNTREEEINKSKRGIVLKQIEKGYRESSFSKEQNKENKDRDSSIERRMIESKKKQIFRDITNSNVRVKVESHRKQGSQIPTLSNNSVQTKQSNND